MAIPIDTLLARGRNVMEKHCKIEHRHENSCGMKQSMNFECWADHCALSSAQIVNDQILQVLLKSIREYEFLKFLRKFSEGCQVLLPYLEPVPTQENRIFQLNAHNI